MSKQRSLRKSKLSFDEEEDDDIGSVAVPPASVKAAQQSKIKSKRSDKKNILSFEEDAQDATQKPLKIRPDLRITPSLHAAPVNTSATYTQISAAGEYTAERLKELQRNTKRIPTTTTTTDIGASQLQKHQIIIDEEDADDADMTTIPDKATVQLARAERDRLRHGIPAPDYIPTNDDALSVKLEKLRKNLRNKTRDVLDEDINGGVIDINHTTHGSGGGGGVTTAAIETIEDEEDAAWAEEQIRKGMASSLHISTNTAIKSKKSTTTTTPSATAALFQSTATRTAITTAAEKALASLKSGLQQAQLTRQQSERNYDKIQRSMTDCLTSITRTEEELQHAGDKYTYFQRLRAFVTDLCAMLAEKSPIIEELQDRLQEIEEERANAHAQRSMINDREEREPAEAGANAATQVLSHGGTLAEAEAAANDAVHAAEQRLLQGHHIPEELDEFGRDMNAQRRAMVSERLKKKVQKRKDARMPRMTETGIDAMIMNTTQDNTIIDDNSNNNGDTTSSESESETTRYTSRYTDIQQAARAVMKDVDDQFSTITSVKSTFEEWKYTYPRQYHDVYMPMTIPALFAPFVRLELLSWQPLDVRSEGFDSHEWYQQLFEYGMKGSGGENGGGDTTSSGVIAHMDGNDADSDLVPTLVCNLILPIAMHLIDKVWNPKSTRQSRAVARLVEDLLVYIPSDNEKLHKVISMVKDKLERIVGGVNIPAWPPAVMASSTRAQVFASKQFHRGLRVLRSVCSFEESLPGSFVRHVALEVLVKQQLLPYVRMSASDPLMLSTRAMLLLDALPSGWLKSGGGGGGGDVHLKGLVDVVVAVAKSLEGDCGYEERRKAKGDAAKGVARVLIKLGESEAGHRLAMLFGVNVE